MPVTCYIVADSQQERGNKPML